MDGTFMALVCVVLLFCSIFGAMGYKLFALNYEVSSNARTLQALVMSLTYLDGKINDINTRFGKLSGPQIMTPTN